MSNNPNFSNLVQGSRMNPPNFRARGPFINWADSIMSVAFYEIIEGAPSYYPFFSALGTSWTQQFLLFGQDFPVICRPFSFYETPTTPAIGDYPVCPEYTPLLEDRHFNGTNGVGNLLYTTTQPIPYNYKSGIYGRSLTNGVSVSGFPMRMQLINHDYEDDETNLLHPIVQMDVVFNSTVPAGKMNYHDHDQVGMQIISDTQIVPVILLETNYTEAMFEANNTYTYVNGAFTTILLICGIFQEEGGGIE